MNAIAKPVLNAGPDQWGAFLRPLLLAVSNPPSMNDFRAKVPVMAIALCHIPADMLTEWRQRDMLRAFRFFPSAAELDEWFRPALLDRKQTESALALPAPKPEPRAERTPEEIAEARAKVQAFMAERNAAGGPAEMAPVEPRYLSDGHLLASLEKIAAEGGPCAGASRLRANALRARMQAQRVSA